MDDKKPDVTRRPEPAAPAFKTLEEAAAALADPDNPILRDRRVEGRTLPKGFHWSGHDLPGRGAAAARRLKQRAKGMLKS